MRKLCLILISVVLFLTLFSCGSGAEDVVERAQPDVEATAMAMAASDPPVVTTPEPTVSEQAVSEAITTPTVVPIHSEPPPTEPVVVEATSEPSAVSTEWQQFLIDYEAWVDSYISFMAEYEADSSDAALLVEYLELVAEMSEWAESSTSLQEDLTPEDLVVYMETMTRISQKLLSVS